MTRLESTENQLRKKLEVCEAYKKSINHYLGEGYIREVKDSNEKLQTKWYLPHFPVVKPDRETTKVRIVFDGSEKGSEKPLNDVINQGPKLQNDIFDVLLRFRRHDIAIVCDIKEMYHQIAIPEDERKYFRFFWRDMNSGIPPKTYEFQRVVFGISSSPFQAQFVSRYNAKKHMHELGLAAETVLKSCYMDDCLDSVDSVEKALNLYHELIELWGRANMLARKWMSNSTEVLREIPNQNRANEIDLDKSELPTKKTLGVIWQADKDLFRFQINNKNVMANTKRLFLKKMSAVFDPLGFIAPVIFQAKVLIQEMWVQNLEWDTKLEGKLERDVNKWCQDLDRLENLKIDRCFAFSDSKDHVIHMFSDASIKGYAAVSYWNSKIDGKGVGSRLIASKSRVAPLTSLSVPRLELLAVDLGVSLAERITKSLGIQMSKVKFWTDSNDVLGWLRNRTRIFKPFVAHRIGKIHELTDVSQWNFISSTSNPADAVSRGQNVQEFLNNEVWLKGPEFLNTYTENQDCEILEKTSGKFNSCQESTTIFFNAGIGPDWRLSPNRFSSLTRLVRVKAWVTRFINNCSSQCKESGELSAEEIELSTLQLIKEAQFMEFGDELTALSQKRTVAKNSPISALTPFLDADGILRSNSRIQYAELLNYDTKFPIILPKKNEITKLFIKEQHEKEFHVGGTNQTLAALSAKFWINAAREEIRRWENECNTCKKNKAKISGQLMANLPKHRLGSSLRAFTKIGVCGTLFN